MAKKQQPWGMEDLNKFRRAIKAGMTPGEMRGLTLSLIDAHARFLKLNATGDLANTTSRERRDRRQPTDAR